MIRRGGSRRARGTLPYGSPFAAAMRSMGAIAHFDPSVRAADDGTTSTWTDRIGGNKVTSTSQASRLVYSSSLASLNGRPGWSGTSAANSNLQNTASTALGLAMAGLLPHTIYTVRRATLTTGAIYMSSSKAAGTDYWYTGNLNGVNNSSYVRNQAGQTVNTGIIQHTADASVAVHTFTGSTGAVHDNGAVSLAPTANIKNIDTNNLCIGGLIIGTAVSLCFDGDIGDIIIFPTAHTDDQRRYVEQLIAAKYGWPCIQGLSGYSTSNFLYTALDAGVRGATGVGVWTDALVRFDALPGGTLYASSLFGTDGHGLIGASSPAHLGRIASVNSISPSSAVSAAEVGKLWLWGGTCDLSFSRSFKNGVEAGAGTAMAGYTRPASDGNLRHILGGQASGGPNSTTVCQTPAINVSIFGVAGGDVPQTAANQAARAAAIKAAGKFVGTGGATPTHAWALATGGTSFSDIVGADTATVAGTLTRAQCIVTSWPW